MLWSHTVIACAIKTSKSIPGILHHISIIPPKVKILHFSGLKYLTRQLLLNVELYFVWDYFQNIFNPYMKRFSLIWMNYKRLAAIIWYFMVSWMPAACRNWDITGVSSNSLGSPQTELPRSKLYFTAHFIHSDVIHMIQQFITSVGCNKHFSLASTAA